MTTATKNGAAAPRKQLSEQLDRLDAVIDALDEGLKGAVADAVREAVGAAVNEAVQAVRVQMLTNPELQKMIRQAAATPAQEQQHPPQPQPREEEPPRPSAPPPPRSRQRTGLWGKVCSGVRVCAEVAGAAVAAVHLGWTICSSRTKALTLGAVAAVAGMAYACRDHVAAVASAAWEGVKALTATAFGWLLPAFALAG